MSHSEDTHPQSISQPQTVVIAIDAMGGDHGPRVTVAGAAEALSRDTSGRLRFVLHGDEALIAPELAKLPALKAVATIAHTDQFIAMDEKPAQALRRKGTSLFAAIASVKARDAHAVVSAGNTGALMALSKMLLKMMTDDLERPAIACGWPNEKGGMGTVLDVGANVTSDANQLIEFAVMGTAFHRAVRGKDRPTVGLLNVGSEDVKGHEEVREAHRILREGVDGINYHGFVEGDDIGKGTVDVVVTDGFTGNIALKTAEGTAKFVKNLFKGALKSTPLAMAGALLASSALKKMARSVDPGAANGGPLLGLNGIVVKSHGGAEAWAFSNAVSVAISLAASTYEHDIRQALAQVNSAHGLKSDTVPADKAVDEKVS
ncbi:phosphate acyltransferase PlsX [Asticcacaulis sp. YBE204]|uniref:phosphate acyltransferase PlsX n=1 Tax=Asticcacaulis sp. YBE204 TaxID=1282363 RepID=UPI0004110AEC|nr:phosphate acyltransferase PlsX [Asticcacaulis sp. YBE204]